jgi:hypothetical protein
MINSKQIENETAFAVIYLRAKATPCYTCGKQPDQTKESGLRILSCGGSDCEKTASYGKLDAAFLSWNSLQNSLAARLKKR